MPISSLIIRAVDDRISAVSAALEAHPAIEISHVSDGAIAIITETPAGDVDKHLWKQIEAIAGVTHVELIYHNFEDLEEKKHENE